MDLLYCEILCHCQNWRKGKRMNKIIRKRMFYNQIHRGIVYYQVIFLSKTLQDLKKPVWCTGLLHPILFIPASVWVLLYPFHWWYYIYIFFFLFAAHILHANALKTAKNIDISKSRGPVKKKLVVATMFYVTWYMHYGLWNLYFQSNSHYCTQT